MPVDESGKAASPYSHPWSVYKQHGLRPGYPERRPLSPKAKGLPYLPISSILPFISPFIFSFSPFIALHFLVLTLHLAFHLLLLTFHLLLLAFHLTFHLLLHFSHLVRKRE